MFSVTDLRTNLFRLSGTVLALLLAGCGGQRATVGLDSSGQPLPFHVPALPQDQPAPPRSASGAPVTIEGNQIFDHAGGSVSSTDYVLTPPAGGVQWAVYQF